MIVAMRLLDTAICSFWLPLFLQLFVISVTVSSPPACPLLSDRTSLPSLGSAGLKFITDPFGKPFIASANFWDGVSRDMSAMSTIHDLSIMNDELLSVSSPVMNISTKGAHGIDAFETVDGTKMVVIVNYYGCGGSVEESREKKVDFMHYHTSLINNHLVSCHCTPPITNNHYTTTTTTVSRMSLYCHLLLE